jgi:hypothetical protein
MLRVTHSYVRGAGLPGLSENYEQDDSGVGARGLATDRLTTLAQCDII